MDHCPGKAKTHKPKGGKCCCSAPRLSKRLPYATISNRTADNELGAPISLTVDGTAQVLWSTPALQPVSTCTNGPLRTWFDASTGEFTIQETGLYTVTFTGDTTPPPPSTGYLTTRLGYFLVDVDKRCVNTNLPPTGNHEFALTPNNSTASTVSATLPFVAGDVITFEALSFLTGVSVPTNFIFQIDVVQHSRVDTFKVLETVQV